ncbi:MAG: DUF2203 domain-containing protein [Deltaproteobacteria bacterium]|nr:DUF2203 domain-containing protein [Deltaproteobacteria bacterium]
MSSDVPLLRRPKRYFTPEEANASLASVRARVEELEKGLQRAHELSSTLDQSTSGREVTQAEIGALKAQVRDAMEEINRRGIEIKGIRPALLDFPALRDGNEVYLCWKEGEDAITHWHPVHTGIRGRQPLEGDRGNWCWFE